MHCAEVEMTMHRRPMVISFNPATEGEGLQANTSAELCNVISLLCCDGAEDGFKETQKYLKE